MSEEKKQEVMEQIREALSEIPDELQAGVGKAITHDIGVMARTIAVVNEQRAG